MPAIAVPLPKPTFEQYLRLEEDAETRHEYIEGNIVAMAGASEQHELVAGALFAELFGHLRGKKCRVFKGDMKLKVRVNERDRGFYPDIMVVCDPADSAPTIKESPKLLVEVLSKDEDRDLVEKYLTYQKIPTLEEYLVINPDPEAPKLMLFKRSEDWKAGNEFTTGEVRLDSVDFTFSVEGLFEE